MKVHSLISGKVPKLIEKTYVLVKCKERVQNQGLNFGTT